MSFTFAKSRRIYEKRTEKDEKRHSELDSLRAGFFFCSSCLLAFFSFVLLFFFEFPCLLQEQRSNPDGIVGRRLRVEVILSRSRPRYVNVGSASV